MINDEIKKATDTVKETLLPISEEFKKVTSTLKDTLLQDNPHANVGKTDRIISVGTGAYIFFKGITNLFSSPILALTEAGIGAALLHRGITGNCAIKKVIDDMDETDETSAKFGRPYPSSVGQL